MVSSTFFLLLVSCTSAFSNLSARYFLFLFHAYLYRDSVVAEQLGGELHWVDERGGGDERGCGAEQGGGARW